MGIWQGTFFSVAFELKDCVSGQPIDITDWEFRSHFRISVESEELLLELTSSAGEFVIHDGRNGIFSMQIQPSDTASLPLDTLYFDVQRTSPSPGPLQLFWGTIPVYQPVTRGSGVPV